MARLWVYIVYFPVHCVDVTNMSPRYYLSPRPWWYIKCSTIQCENYRVLSSGCIEDAQKPEVTSNVLSQAFSVSVLTVWNSVKPDLHSVDSLGSFETHCSLQFTAASHSTVQSHPALLIHIHQLFLVVFPATNCSPPAERFISVVMLIIR